MAMHLSTLLSKIVAGFHRLVQSKAATYIRGAVWKNEHANNAFIVLGGTALLHYRSVMRTPLANVGGIVDRRRALESSIPARRHLSTSRPSSSTTSGGRPPSRASHPRIDDTSRTLCAASEAEPTVIAIDFRLTTTGDSVTDLGAPLGTDESYLLDTLADVGKKRIPVVVSTFLVRDNGPAGWRRLPNIFPDDTLPQRVVVGHINMPDDGRELPLHQPGMTADGRISELVCPHLQNRSSTSTKRKPIGTREPNRIRRSSKTIDGINSYWAASCQLRPFAPTS